VLYEMATGQKAFSGKSQASLISSIMGSQPGPVSAIVPMTPPAFDRVVRTCLAKDPDDRWQTAHDVMLELKWVAEGGSAAGLPAPTVARRRSRERVLWGAAGLAGGAVLTAVAAATLLQRPAPTPRRSVGFALTFSAAQPFADAQYQSFALSPDGSRLVYAGGSGRQRRLYVRAMDRIAATPIPGTEGGSHPFFSPDGQSIGFLAEGKLKKLTFGGGAPVVLYHRHSPLGGSWAPDDTILFTPDFTGGIWKISSRGGEANRVIAPDPARKERAYILPTFFPDGKTALFTIWTGGSFDEAKIGLLDLATGKHRIVLEGGTDARYSRTGHLLYGRGGAIHAVSFDPKALAVTGPPVTILDGVMSDTLNGNFFFDFSREGSLAYVPGTVRIPEYDLIAVDRKGAAQTITGGRPYAEPNVSPEGKRVAVTIQTSTFDVWIYDLDRGTLSRLSFGGDDSQPRWSPDGKRVVYSSSRAGVPNLFWRYADASGPEERLAASEHPQFPQCFTPDGRALIFVDVDRTTREDIWVLPLDGRRKPVPFLRTPFREGLAALSPDGRWIAYASDESGRGEIYVQPYPGPGGRIQISPDGGNEPLWSTHGRELYYRNQEKVLAVSIQTEPSFSVSRPTVLFEGRYGEEWDVSPDGQRFFMVKEKQVDPATRQIHVLLGWLDARRRLPAAKGF
jgi:Tol biopolymer transport system component